MPQTPVSPRPLGSTLLLAFALVAPALAGCGSDSNTPSDAGQPVTSAFAVHYHRAAGDYDGWTVQVSAGADQASATNAGTDGWGASYALTVKSGATSLGFTLVNGSSSEPAPFTIDVSGSVREAWIFAGYSTPLTHKPAAVPSKTQVALYYARADKVYSGWGLHTWGDQVPNTDWGTPLQPAGVDPDLGAGFLIDLKTGAPAGNCPPGNYCVIVHKADTKDPGADMHWDPAQLGRIVFVTSGSPVLTTFPRKAGAVDISGASAHLVAHDTVAWNAVADPANTSGSCVLAADAKSFELRTSPTAEIKATDTDITGGSVITLTPRPAGLSAAVLAQNPHMAGWCAFDVAAADQAKLPDVVKGQIVAVARKASGAPFLATQVQLPWLLDELYATDAPLGLVFAAPGPSAPAFALWAPTAQSVKLHVASDSQGASEVAGSPFTMTPSADGKRVYGYAGTAAMYGKYYRYELTVYHYASGKIETVLVSDPYAANLGTNGQWAQIVDLRDPALAPASWATFTKPALASVNDIVLYEGQIRDFSVFDPTVPAAHRGKFLAFTDQASNGMKHLQALAAAGLTHLHLLPVFDIATVDEDATKRIDVDQPLSALCAKASAPADATQAATWSALCTASGSKTITEVMASLPADSDQQQLVAGQMHGIDSFNWGYDPFHYGAPEGSYASTAEGTAKIVEFRQMVQGLAQSGLRLVMDVVYNHTNASGLGPYSVLDKVVPGYYHRLTPDTGFVESSTCCANTATEHRMMERLMIDTLVRWARDYKVDGFRFDLMGHHMKSNMLKAQAALQALTLAADGVDGSKIYLYGEGWDFGEVKLNGRGVNASQINMADTGIGTFNDRVRDGVRGGSPFDSATATVSDWVPAAGAVAAHWGTCVQYKVCGGQGFASGLFTDTNEATPADTTAHDVLIAMTDWVKIGMAGGLKDFVVQNAQGTTIAADGVGYSGASAGYTKRPQESINYVSAHDNQDLWDIFQYKLPQASITATRVRMHGVALDTVLLGQGIPFIHLGDDILRSKSEDKNSYDSGDWFNRVDWSLTGNGWKSGLPPAGDNSSFWTAIKGLFGLAPAVAGPADITASFAHVQEMLKVRKSTPLLHLQTGDQVKKRVDFPNAGPNQVPGLIVMTITDGTCAGADLDPQRDAVVVIVNADKAAHDYTITGATGFTLHSILQASADATVKTAAFSAGKFTVPARTSAVFEQLQTGAQGAGLACNTR